MVNNNNLYLKRNLLILKSFNPRNNPTIQKYILHQRHSQSLKYIRIHTYAYMHICTYIQNIPISYFDLAVVGKNELTNTLH